MSPVDPDVIDCFLTASKLSGRRCLRIDTAAMPDGFLKDLAVQFEREARSWIGMILKEVPEQSRRPTYFFFTEDAAYNAFAMTGRQYDFMVLNIGVIPTILDFSQRMMATPGLWPDIGNQPPAPAHQECPSAAAIPAHAAWSVLTPRTTNDPVRIAVAVAFMIECFSFIVRHELAHLVLRRLDSDSQCIVKGDAIASHALELAADGHAAIWGLAGLRVSEKMSHMPGEGIILGYREFHRTRTETIANYLLVIYFAFRFMDEPRCESFNLAGRRHPPGPFRFHAARIHLDEHFQHTRDDDARNVLWQAELWERGEMLFAKALGREPDREIEMRTMSAASEEHYEKISARSRSMPHHLFGVVAATRIAFDAKSTE